MKTFIREDLKRLIEVQDSPCVSFYVSTRPAGVEAQQGRINLKNLLSDAVLQLKARGWSQGQVQAFLKPIEELDKDPKFWLEQRQGLALFLATDRLFWWKVSCPFENQLWIGPRFHIKSLVPLVESDRFYYLLAVSQHNVHLYRGDDAGLQELEIDGLPHSLDEVVKHGPHERIVEARTGQPALRGKESAVFHGQGDLSKLHKRDLRRFLQLIERSIGRQLKGSTAPLVFAGVDELFSIYADLNCYPQFVKSPLAGSVEHRSIAELGRAAFNLLAPVRAEPRLADVHRIESFLGTEYVSGNVEELVPMAEKGRLELVFVASDETVWGRHCALTGMVEALSAAGSDGEDLLDRIAAATWTHGGQVYAVPAAEVPGGLLVAGLYRVPKAARMRAAH